VVIGVYFRIDSGIRRSEEKLSSDRILTVKTETLDKTKRVLVIDDEEAVVKPIEHILRLFHYEPFTATQWADALDLLDRETFDLITLDLEMPTIDGPTMLKFIRENGHNTPVVVVSASITDKTPDDLAEFDVSAFVYKPFKVTHIKEIIEGVIGQSAPPDDIREAADIEDVLQNVPQVLPPQKGNSDDGDASDHNRRRRRKRRNNKIFKNKEQRNQTLIAMAVIALICLFLSGFMEVFKTQVEGMF